MEGLLNFDYYLFDLINQGLSNPIFDIILPILRNKLTWIPAYILIIGLILFKYGKMGALLILFLIMTVGLADGVSSHIVKKNVKRLRPCNNIGLSVVERIHCGSGYSFTSSHATNHFAISFFLIFTIAYSKKLRYLLFFWALIVAFSQVYVGVHFPSDILAGAILGILIAFIGSIMWKKADKIFFHKKIWLNA